MSFCRYITNILSVHLLQFYSAPHFQMSGYATANGNIDAAVTRDEVDGTDGVLDCNVF